MLQQQGTSAAKKEHTFLFYFSLETQDLLTTRKALNVCTLVKHDQLQDEARSWPS